MTQHSDSGSLKGNPLALRPLRKNLQFRDRDLKRTYNENSTVQFTRPAPVEAHTHLQRLDASHHKKSWENWDDTFSTSSDANLT
jgi:hypothetical protein